MTKPRSTAVGVATLARLALVLVALAFLPQLAVAEGPRTIVDDAGRTVSLPPTVGRVLAAGPSAEVVLYTLAPEKLVGWVKAPSAEARPYLAAPYRDLPVAGPLTGKGNTVNAAAIKALRPDLIVDIGDIDPGYVALADKVSQETGIPYVLLDGTLASTARTYETLGGMLGESARAERLATAAEDLLRRVRELADGIPSGERPRIYYGRGPDGLQTGLAGSLNTEFIAAVGGINVADSLGPGALTTVTPARIVAWNPDVIVTLDKAFATRVETDPIFAGVAAVRDVRIYRATTLPFGWVDSPPSVNRLLGLLWLASSLSPTPEARQVELRSSTHDFYRLFYQVELSPEQVDALLAEAGLQSKSACCR